MWAPLGSGDTKLAGLGHSISLATRSNLHHPTRIVLAVLSLMTTLTRALGLAFVSLPRSISTLTPPLLPDCYIAARAQPHWPAVRCHFYVHRHWNGRCGRARADLNSSQVGADTGVSGEPGVFAVVAAARKCGCENPQLAQRAASGPASCTPPAITAIAVNFVAATRHALRTFHINPKVASISVRSTRNVCVCAHVCAKPENHSSSRARSRRRRSRRGRAIRLGRS